MAETTEATRQELPAQDADAPQSSARARRMLTEVQVLQIVPVSRRSLYRMLKKGEFPPPIFTSPNRKFWFEDEVIAWQEALDQHCRLRRLRRVPAEKDTADADRIAALRAQARQKARPA